MRFALLFKLESGNIKTYFIMLNSLIMLREFTPAFAHHRATNAAIALLKKGWLVSAFLEAIINSEQHRK